MPTNKIFFSIIIPTRNRPQLLQCALESVMTQSFQNFEIIIVNDGSEHQHLDKYAQLVRQNDSKVSLLNLELSQNGHGASYALNMGVAVAKGQYIGFLDDDDCWFCQNHLENAESILKATSADIYLTLQDAYRDNVKVNEDIWLTPLKKIFPPSNLQPYHMISHAELIKAGNFSHRNTLIIKKTLYDQIKGHDETIHYEEDREFYFRSIDNAGQIVFNPLVVSRHNIPVNALNFSQQSNYFEKLYIRLQLLNKLILNARKLDTRKYAIKSKCYTLKAISENYHQSGDSFLALHYAKEALLVGFSWKWLAFTSWLYLKKVVNK